VTSSQTSARALSSANSGLPSHRFLVSFDLVLIVICFLAFAWSSRRASEVVSPSDIPDSPLDSPQRPLSPKLANSSAQTQETTVAKNFATNSVHKPSATRDTDTVFEDRPINYATEGTPAIFSLSTSLSSLTEDINGIHIDDNNDSKALKESDESMRLSDILEVNDIKTEIIYTSSEDEAEEQLLAACISSGIWRYSRFVRLLCVCFITHLCFVLNE